MAERERDGTYEGTPADQARGGDATGRPGTYPGTPAEADVPTDHPAGEVNDDPAEGRRGG